MTQLIIAKEKSVRGFFYYVLVFGGVLLLLSFVLSGCKEKKEVINRELTHKRIKDEKGRLVKVIVRDKKTKQMVQVRSWQYDEKGRVLQLTDENKEKGDVVRNEYSYENDKLTGIKHYKNDELMALEEFDGHRTRPTRVIHIENGEEVIREITRYQAPGKGPWVYQLKINKLNKTKIEKKRKNQKIYEKKWKDGLLREATIYNKHQRPIQEMPLLKGYHTIIAKHIYEKSNKNVIKVTLVSWYDNPKVVIDKIYPIKKEKFGVSLTAQQPQQGIKVLYWKRAGKIELTNKERVLTHKGQPLW